MSPSNTNRVLLCIFLVDANDRLCIGVGYAEVLPPWLLLLLGMQRVVPTIHVTVARITEVVLLCVRYGV